MGFLWVFAYYGFLPIPIEMGEFILFALLQRNSYCIVAI